MRTWVWVPALLLGAEEVETGRALELADHLVQTNLEALSSVKDLVSEVWYRVIEEGT